MELAEERLGQPCRACSFAIDSFGRKSGLGRKAGSKALALCQPAVPGVVLVALTIAFVSMRINRFWNV